MQIRFLALALASAVAMTAGAASADVPRERVFYGDLQLTSPEGQAELERRIQKAAWRVCTFDIRGQLVPSDHYSVCYRQAKQTASVEIAQILAEDRLAANESQGDRAVEDGQHGGRLAAAR